MYLSYKLAAFLTRCMVRNGSIEDNQIRRLSILSGLSAGVSCLLCNDISVWTAAWISAFWYFVYPGPLFSKELLRRDPCPFQTFVHSVFLLMFFAAFGLFSLRHQIPDTAWFFITLAWLPGDLLYKRQRQCHKRIYKRAKKTPGMAPPPGILYLSGNLCPFLVVRT